MARNETFAKEVHARSVLLGIGSRSSRLGCGNANPHHLTRASSPSRRPASSTQHDPAAWTVNDEEEPANGGLFFMLPELRDTGGWVRGTPVDKSSGRVAVGSAAVGTGGGLTSMQTGGHTPGGGAAPPTHAGGQSGGRLSRRLDWQARRRAPDARSVPAPSAKRRCTPAGTVGSSQSELASASLQAGAYSCEHRPLAWSRRSAASRSHRPQLRRRLRPVADRSTRRRPSHRPARPLLHRQAAPSTGRGVRPHRVVNATGVLRRGAELPRHRDLVRICVSRIGTAHRAEDHCRRERSERGYPERRRSQAAQTAPFVRQADTLDAAHDVPQNAAGMSRKFPLISPHVSPPDDVPMRG